MTETTERELTAPNPLKVLQLAESCGAVIAGKPDGSEAIGVTQSVRLVVK